MANKLEQEIIAIIKRNKGSLECNGDPITRLMGATRAMRAQRKLWREALDSLTVGKRVRRSYSKEKRATILSLR